MTITSSTIGYGRIGVGIDPNTFSDRYGFGFEFGTSLGHFFDVDDETQRRLLRNFTSETLEPMVDVDFHREEGQTIRPELERVMAWLSENSTSPWSISMAPTFVFNDAGVRIDSFVRFTIGSDDESIRAIKEAVA